MSMKMEEKGEDDKELRVIAKPFWQEFQAVFKEVEGDLALQKIRKELMEDPNSHPALYSGT